jgi:hypothetical protein
MAVVALWHRGGAWQVGTPLDVPLLCFLAWVFVTIPFSIDPDYSFREWRKLAAQVLLFYWSVAVLRHDSERRAVKGVLVAVVAGTAVCAGLAIVEFFMHGGTWRGRDVRAGAFGSDYNWLSTYMVMAIPIVLAATMLLRESWARVLGVGTTGLAFAAEVMAYTRAGWMGLLAEAVVAVWLTGRRWLLIAFVALVVSAAAGVGVMLWSSEDNGRETTEVMDPWTFKARLAVWKLAAADLLEHPIVGVGYGNDNFVKRYAGHPELEKAHGPHSTFVVIGLGSGVPALGLFVWLLLTIFLSLTRPFRLNPAPPVQPLPTQAPPGDQTARMVSFGVALMVVGFTVRNLFDYMLIGGLANLFWILVAVALSLAQQPERTQLSPRFVPGASSVERPPKSFGGQ